MNWRAIRFSLLFILVILNLGLFTYNVMLRREKYIIPEERILLVKEQYQRKGYVLPETLPRKQYPMERLLLQKMDLEERADGFWNQEYEKSYMIGSKVLYTCGTEVITLDRDAGRMYYEQQNPQITDEADSIDNERLAISFARILMQEEKLELVQVLKGDEGAVIYVFCQEYDEKLIFGNRIAVTIRNGAVLEAAMQQYEVLGYEEEERFIYPIDEVLFACLDELDTTTQKTPLNLFYGYDVIFNEDGRYYGEPHILVCNDKNTGILVDQCTVEFNILQYH